MLAPASMNHSKRTVSLTNILDSSTEVSRSLQGTSKQRDNKSDVTKRNNTLRRCKSNPEKTIRKKYQDTKPNDLLRLLDIERGYVTDLIADAEEPTIVQPQLSYFAYLGKNSTGKGRYQCLSLSDNTHTVINLGNAIYFQNRANSSSRLANTIPEVMEIQRNSVTESLKADNTELLECCTCLCCVKALFYHCTKDGEMQRNWADKPCACEGPGAECVARWGLLGMLSLFLPCLLCYPILNGCYKPWFYMRRKWEP